MRKTFALIGVAVGLAFASGCTDQQTAQWSALGSSHTIHCYSGGKEILTDTATGKVSVDEGGNVSWKSKDTERLREANAGMACWVDTNAS